MNIHLPAILMFTMGIGFWPIPKFPIAVEYNHPIPWKPRFHPPILTYSILSHKIYPIVFPQNPWFYRIITLKYSCITLLVNVNPRLITPDCIWVANHHFLGLPSLRNQPGFPIKPRYLFINLYQIDLLLWGWHHINIYICIIIYTHINIYIYICAYIVCIKYLYSIYI